MERFHHRLLWIRELLERDLIERCMSHFWREGLQIMSVGGWGFFRKERGSVVMKTGCGYGVYIHGSRVMRGACLVLKSSTQGIIADSIELAETFKPCMQVLLSRINLIIVFLSGMCHLHTHIW